MSDFYAVALIMALFVPSCFVYVYLDRTLQDRYDAIATGVVRGVQVTGKYRQLLLYTRLLPAILVVVTIMSFWALGFLMLAENAGAEEARLFGYLAAFLVGWGVVGWIVLGGAVFFHLRSVSLQAEID
jgi:predicted secreted protein